MRIAGLVLVLVILVGFLPPAIAVEQTRMARTTSGCSTPDLYRSALGMQENHDRLALEKLMRSGRCRTLDPGTLVTLEGSAYTGEVQVRVRGQTHGWWTGSDQVLP